MGVRDGGVLHSLLTHCMVLLVGLHTCKVEMENKTPTDVKLRVETGPHASDGLGARL